LISQKEVLIKWHISEWCSYCRCKTHRSKSPYETIHCRRNGLGVNSKLFVKLCDNGQGYCYYFYPMSRMIGSISSSLGTLPRNWDVAWLSAITNWCHHIVNFILWFCFWSHFQQFVGNWDSFA